MSSPILYRRRLIPDECILLDKDTILINTPDYLVTKWDTIRPKKNLARGVSMYVWKEGVKISKMFDQEGRFLYWYCDIITHEYHAKEDTYMILDLLADVLIYPDGQIQVVDLDELADAVNDGKLTMELLQMALRQLNGLLQKLYKGEFSQYQDVLNEWE